jgi:quercetin dioxygenase-like cupin family protein
VDEARGTAARRAACTLIKDGPLRVTIVGIAGGGSLAEHRAGGPVSIHAMDGAVDVSIGGSTQRLEKGQALVLGADVTHSLSAAEDAAILLTIAVP